MTYRELKKKLSELVSTYFGDATVIWGMAGAVSPTCPLVTLTMGDVVRHYLPIRGNVNGVPVDYYPSRTTVQVDLFTKGVGVTTEAGYTARRENTAVGDMIDFVNFLNSIYVDGWSDANDVYILANQVRDLTELVNDTTWEYRAMVELEIGFTQAAVGHTATMYEGGVLYDEEGNPAQDAPPFEPTPSGGRTQDLADQSTGWFDQVEDPEFIKED